MKHRKLTTKFTIVNIGLGIVKDILKNKKKEEGMNNPSRY